MKNKIRLRKLGRDSEHLESMLRCVAAWWSCDGGAAAAVPATAERRPPHDPHFPNTSDAHAPPFAPAVPACRNMAASLIHGGKKSDLAGYYIHIEPGNSIIGGGKYMTDPPMLKRIRQEIDYNWEEFRGIIRNKKFVSAYGDIDKSPEFSLSREPRDYEKDNPAIDYIKLKSWIAFRPLTDTELTEKTLVKKIVQTFEALQPLINFLNRAIAE